MGWCADGLAAVPCPPHLEGDSHRGRPGSHGPSGHHRLSQRLAHWYRHGGQQRSRVQEQHQLNHEPVRHRPCLRLPRQHQHLPHDDRQRQRRPRERLLRSQLCPRYHVQVRLHRGRVQLPDRQLQQGRQGRRPRHRLRPGLRGHRQRRLLDAPGWPERPHAHVPLGPHQPPARRRPRERHRRPREHPWRHQPHDRRWHWPLPPDHRGRWYG